MGAFLAGVALLWAWRLAILKGPGDVDASRGPHAGPQEGRNMSDEIVALSR